MRTSAPPDYGPHEIAGLSLADVILRSGRNSKPHRTARGRQPLLLSIDYRGFIAVIYTGCGPERGAVAPTRWGRSAPWASDCKSATLSRRHPAPWRRVGNNLPARRHSLHPYTKYIDRHLSINANNRPDGVPCGFPAGLSACSGYISATQILPPTYPSHICPILRAYPSPTSFMGPSCMEPTQTPPEPPSSAWRAPIHPWECTHFSIPCGRRAGRSRRIA